MAGGGGTRLWPLSSPERPKPFLPLLGDRTLLQLSADRLEGLVEPESVFVVTDRRYVGHVAAQLPAATILAEPEGRNTAAAIAYATVAIDRPDDEVMLVLPADQTVRLVEEFGTSRCRRGHCRRRCYRRFATDRYPRDHANLSCDGLRLCRAGPGPG